MTTIIYPQWCLRNFINSLTISLLLPNKPLSPLLKQSRTTSEVFINLTIKFFLELFNQHSLFNAVLRLGWAQAYDQSVPTRINLRDCVRARSFAYACINQWWDDTDRHRPGISLCRPEDFGVGVSRFIWHGIKFKDYFLRKKITF